jgi:hypothetical protein
MSTWSQLRFLDQARDVGARIYLGAHTTFLEKLRRAGAVPTFDGKGDKEATYTVRAADGANWHILRVNANGEVILMLNHLRDYHSKETAARAEALFTRHIRSQTTEAPRLARNSTEFAAMDFDGVASAIREVAAIIAKH